LECSGQHRGLGVHLTFVAWRESLLWLTHPFPAVPPPSFVRSVTMDTWSPKQLKMMQVSDKEPTNKIDSPFPLLLCSCCSALLYWPCSLFVCWNVYSTKTACSHHLFSHRWAEMETSRVSLRSTECLKTPRSLISTIVRSAVYTRTRSLAWPRYSLASQAKEGG